METFLSLFWFLSHPTLVLSRGHVVFANQSTYIQTVEVFFHPGGRKGCGERVTVVGRDWRPMVFSPCPLGSFSLLPPDTHTPLSTGPRTCQPQVEQLIRIQLVRAIALRFFSKTTWRPPAVVRTLVLLSCPAA
ncbi:hypothetical protein C0Q70_11534 [Pomacea canaliculata]|uniref:IPT/TIG domain-containing protein n=1 Tax=Pomacea canaliculata TaxID=400727 RepID=A0A2T7P697_POMCA|nr:hypothetical protein C0Q70_11534 [Pomacea canaliculata]